MKEEAPRLPETSEILNNKEHLHAEHDYDQLTPEAVELITKDAITRSEALIHQVENSAETNYETTLQPYIEAGDTLRMSFAKTGFMAYVHPDEKVRAAAVESQQNLSEFDIGIIFREKLYEKFKAFSETAEAAELEGEEARSLEHLMRDFKNSGHELDEDSRERLQAMHTRLSQAGIEFQQNINNDDTKVKLSPNELIGLSQGFIDNLDQDEDGNYLLKVGAYPQTVPFLKNSFDRNARAKVSAAFNSRAVEENKPILEEAVQTRQQIAATLGYDSWADYKMQDRMAKTPENVARMYEDLLEPLSDKAYQEKVALEKMLHTDGHTGELQKYDVAFYENQIRKNYYNIDQEKIAEYMPLDSAVEGMFAITGKTFGLKYRQLDLPAWHEDVTAYAIIDGETGEEISQFYMDLFPREGKFSHAAAFDLKPGRELPDGSYRKPESAIVANFTEPSGDNPSLLKYGEVVTLYHEFGHILHQTLTKARLPEFAGTNTERDFVEAPSQIMEHWMREPEVVQQFARHYQTGESIPAETIENLVASEKLNVGLTKLRQISLGAFDLSIHDETEPKNLDELWEKSNEISLLPHQKDTFMPASFGHLLGGYDAGYYGYLWAEVYGDDMYSRFKQEGLTNPQVGLDYRHKILEKGGTLDGDEMLRNFLGREPNNQAFLKDLGIKPESKEK